MPRAAVSDTAPPPAAVVTPENTGDTLDFALAFAAPRTPRSTRPPRPAVPPGRSPGGAWTPSRTFARVLLSGSVRTVNLKLPRGWELRDARGRARGGMAGEGQLRTAGTGTSAHFSFARERAHEVSLPCTLLSRDDRGATGVDSLTVRGAVAVAAAGRDAVSVLNLIDVEEYLRGVVPLEIGRRPDEQAEAVKAQAVAARTYTYRKMMEREREPYDLQITVADQVYGGVTAEDRGSDRAIAATRGQVLTWEGEPIVAYYHSTCGGSTAAPEEVWDKPAVPYLKVVSDRRPDGTPWCESSSYSRWTVSWKPERLAALLQRYAGDAACGGRFNGRVKALRVDGRFACGRVRKLVIESTGGTAEFCGDRTRFALRRDQSGNPILPSARFEIASENTSEIRISGSGYGHGVGMCQVGALGRAAAGQSCAQILQAYYPGAVLMRVEKPARVAQPQQRL